MSVSSALALLLSATAAHGAPTSHEETVAPLVQQALPGADHRQFTAAEVTFAPGARARPHRHGDAFVYAYVLEGSVRSQLEGGPVRTFRVGQGWTEAPGAHHILTENASRSVRARLLVTFVSPVGQPLKTPDKP